jgi:regulator of replication initiation timing
MKKIFLSLLWLSLLFLWACSLIKNNDSWIHIWNIEEISKLEQQLSWLFEQFSWLQAENNILKEYLSWTVINLKKLKEENEKLKTQKTIIENKINNNSGTNQNPNKVNTTNNTQKNITRNRYNSSLWFSMILPWECIDGVTIKEWPPYSIYHWMQDLNYSWSNNKNITCFLPDHNNIDSILGLIIHDHICDVENNQHYPRQQIQFWNNHFIFYTIQSLEWSIYKCYKTNYNNQTLRFTFSRWYSDNLIQTILESIDNAI